MWQIVSPILIIFGTTGNVISILVMSQKKFSRWSSSIFLIGLAVADLSVLYVGLLRQWVIYMFGWDFRSSHPVVCKVHWWLVYVCADIPVLILTAITVERLISTLCPFRSKKICTKNKAKVVLGIILVTALVINSHLLFGFGQLGITVGNETMYIPCAPITEKYEHFFAKVWPWIDLCKFSLIPFVILSSGNVCIIYKLISSRRKVMTRVCPLNSRTDAAPTASGTGGRTSYMSILLICLNFVFIFCTLPICVYFIGEPYWIPKDIPRSVQLQDPWWALVNMFMYANNSCNFIMYCLTGSRFRNSVRELFKKGTSGNLNASSRFGGAP